MFHDPKTDVHTCKLITKWMVGFGNPVIKKTLPKNYVSMRERHGVREASIGCSPRISGFIFNHDDNSGC